MLAVNAKFMLKIIQKRKIFYVFSGVLCLLSVLSLIFWGLKPAIDFTGGTLMEVQFNGMSRPSVAEVREKFSALNLGIGDLTAQQAGESGMILRTSPIDEAVHQNLLQGLRDSLVSGNGQIEETRFESIGPTIGKELQKKSMWSIILVVLGIILYIAWAFRKVSRPVSSWMYGLGAIVALCHDILITTGLFSVLGHFFNVEVDALFISALLTILGYSVNDTIVVYDRTRENLRKHEGKFEETVNSSMNQTMARSINTSLTTVLALTAVYFFGGETTKNFALTLIFGIAFGTYSSVFVASALLVDWQKFLAGRRK